MCIPWPVVVARATRLLFAARRISGGRRQWQLSSFAPKGRKCCVDDVTPATQDSQDDTGISQSEDLDQPKPESESTASYWSRRLAPTPSSPTSAQALATNSPPVSALATSPRPFSSSSRAASVGPSTRESVTTAPKTRRTKTVWVVGVGTIVVIAAVAAIVKAVGAKSSGAPTALSARLTAPSTSPTVPSLAASLLQASDVGPGWQAGGVVTGGNLGLTPCASALWAVFSQRDYPAQSVENFTPLGNNGTPLWSYGVTFEPGPSDPHPGNDAGAAVTEAVGTASKQDFEKLSTTLAACPTQITINSEGTDPLQLSAVHPFAIGAQSAAFVMNQALGDQTTYVGYITNGTEYASLWFTISRYDKYYGSPLTQFEQLVSTALSRMSASP